MDANTNNTTNLDNLTDEETIDLFIRGIMQEKGVDFPNEEIEQDAANDLKTKLLEQIDRSLIAELPDDKLEQLNAMAAQDGQLNPDTVAQMIEDAHLDVAEITGITMERFREIYLGQAAEGADRADNTEGTNEKIGE